MLYYINFYNTLLYTGETILLKYVKIQLNTVLKIILLEHENNYVGNSSMTSNVAKNLYILATSSSIHHNYIF